MKREHKNKKKKKEKKKGRKDKRKEHQNKKEKEHKGENRKYIFISETSEYSDLFMGATHRSRLEGTQMAYLGIYLQRY